MKELHVKALQDLATGLGNNGWHDAASIATAAAQFIEQQPGAFDPADMATAAAQGFRDGQMRQIAAAVEIPVRMLQGEDHPDTARLRFVAEHVDEDTTDEIQARWENELPNGVKTLEDIRKLIDIRRGLA